MPAKNALSFEDLMAQIAVLPVSQFQKIQEYYLKEAGIDPDKTVAATSRIYFENLLRSINVNKECPYCGMKARRKVGHQRGLQRYQCANCNSFYTQLTGTFLEKTRMNYDGWVALLHMTLNRTSLEDITENLSRDYGLKGLNIKTVWRMQMKLKYAMSQIPKDTLTGIIQIDEKILRESQKGSRSLENRVKKSDERLPRRGKFRKASKLGPMSADYVNIVTAIDDRGYIACGAISLGRVTTESLLKFFVPRISNPSFICSDDNPIYRTFCDELQIAHFIRPSNYLTVIQNAGYIQPVGPYRTKDVLESNDKLLHQLYDEGIIDRIEGRDADTYDKYLELKRKYNLSLADVNGLHSDMDNYFYGRLRNVSDRFIEIQVGAYEFMHNWETRHNQSIVSMDAARQIFGDLLKVRANYTVLDIENAKPDLPSPTPQETKALNTQTDIARVSTKNAHFKFSVEDGLNTFNKRDFLRKQSKKTLHEFARELELPRGYSNWVKESLIAALCKHPDIENKIYSRIQRDRDYTMNPEDKQYYSKST